MHIISTSIICYEALSKTFFVIDRIKLVLIVRHAYGRLYDTSCSIYKGFMNDYTRPHTFGQIFYTYKGNKLSELFTIVCSE